MNDKARLDWMASHAYVEVSSAKPNTADRIGLCWRRFQGQSLREAIDDAEKIEKESRIVKIINRGVR